MEKISIEKLSIALNIKHDPTIDYGDINDYPRSLGGVPPAWRINWTKEQLREFNSKIGKMGAKAFHAKLSPEQKREWHSKGGKASSKAKQLYKIITPNGETFALKYEQLRDECNKRGWSFNTLHWQAYRKGIISRGPAKGVHIQIIEIEERKCHINH